MSQSKIIVRKAGYRYWFDARLIACTDLPLHEGAISFCHLSFKSLRDISSLCHSALIHQPHSHFSSIGFAVCQTLVVQQIKQPPRTYDLPPHEHIPLVRKRSLGAELPGMVSYEILQSRSSEGVTVLLLSAIRLGRGAIRYWVWLQ